MSEELTIDPSEVPELRDQLSTEELSRAESPAALVATMRSLLAQTGTHEAQHQAMAYGALLNVMAADRVVFVRDDDEKLWPFVKGEEYWRGPLRIQADTQKVEEARFFPEESKIEWVSPWEKPE